MGCGFLSEWIMIFMEIIGTIAFAVSGALIAISSSLDLFGVIFIGCTTAVGGGIMRDILIGKNPPAIFNNTEILLIAALTALVVFIIAYINADHFRTFKEKIEKINNVFDAVGLAAFSVTGTEAAFLSGCGDKFTFSVLMGMLTGVGGGIIRDVLVTKAPYVLKKHIYALASILGSILYYLVRVYTDNTVMGTVVAMILVFSIRMLATKYLWKLPKIKVEETEKKVEGIL